MAKRIYVVFNDELVLIDGIKALQAKGVKCKDLQSPFPVHGIDPLLNVPRTRLSICSFLYGATGTTLALLMTWYMMVHDWPINIGGKPNFMFYMNLPAFIPVTFESTVFCAAHGMAITFLLRSKLLPGVTPPIPYEGITDDKFVLHVDAKDVNDAQAIAALAKSNGAIDVKI